MLPKITLHGRLTRDPELRFTSSGKAVVSFSVAQSNRKKDGEEWVDKDTSFFDCTAWEQTAENVTETLSKGMEVIVLGQMKQRPWEDKDGNKRTSWEVQVEAVGPSLRWGSFSKVGSEGQKAEKPAANDVAPF